MPVHRIRTVDLADKLMELARTGEFVLNVRHVADDDDSIELITARTSQIETR